MGSFTDADIAQLEARGIAVAEARRQLDRLASPPPVTRVVRPCVVGDGIEVVSPAEEERLLARADALQAAGRVSKFVPASGAATRMFKSLLAVQHRSELETAADLEAHDGDPAVAETIRFFREIDSLPFRRGLASRLVENGHTLGKWPDVPLRAALDELLSASGLGYAELPKGLIPFHRYDESRTPIEEHLVEATMYTKDDSGNCRICFSVAPAHADRFRRFLGGAGPRWEERTRSTFDIMLTAQNPSTDTLALDEAGEAVREKDGSLHLRPGGHGALLANLSEMQGDVVVLKNIDNVVTDTQKELLVRWKRLLVGKLAEVESAVHSWCRRLDEAYSPLLAREAIGYLRSTFSRVIPDDEELARPDALQKLLRRPIRVCGMVRNTGEPGGGPFWVVDASAESAQIVEASQIDLTDPEQANVVGAATHFNPVDIVASLRDFRGRPFALPDFVDRDAVFVSEKSVDGRPIRALEHPGLWNGAMAGWHTLFVEVPAETFAPVKSILDLLRPEHQ